MFNPSITTQPSTSFVASSISNNLVNIPLPRVKVQAKKLQKTVKPELGENEIYFEIIKNNDRIAYNKLYADFFQKVKVFIIRKGGSLEDAQDVFQEAFAIIVEKVLSDNLTLTCSLYTYTLRVSRNIWFNKLKKKSNQCLGLTEEVGIYESDLIDEEMNERTKLQLFKEKFAMLPTDKQQVLRLYMEGNSMKEIAQKMGYSSDKYAKKKKCLSLQMLCRLIQADPLYRELTTV